VWNDVLLIGVCMWVGGREYKADKRLGDDDGGGLGWSGLSVMEECRRGSE
jgi:hypothetical protein